jgi:hypothetical protein
MKHFLMACSSLFISLFYLTGCGNSLSERQLPLPSSRLATATRAFPGVVMITGKELCTGTLVGPSTVLTAAHCLRGGGPFTVHTSKGPVQSTQQIQLGTGIEGDPHDLALLYLPSFSAPSNEIIPFAFEGSVGDTVTLVGYGCASSELLSSGGVKRIGTNVIADQTDFLEIATPGIQIKAIAGPENRAGACFGDSGGPLLKQTVKGFAVIGVGHGAYNEGSRQMSQFVNLNHSINKSFLLNNIR